MLCAWFLDCLADRPPFVAICVFLCFCCYEYTFYCFSRHATICCHMCVCVCVCLPESVTISVETLIIAKGL